VQGLINKNKLSFMNGNKGIAEGAVKAELIYIMLTL